MKKMPRWAKTCICVALIAVSWLIITAAYDCPLPTAEAAFRRQEHTMLIGPAQIVDTRKQTYGWYNHTMVGKSDYGYTTLSWWDDQWDDGKMHYFEKTGDITVFCPGYDCGLWYKKGFQLPFFVFTDLPGASWAQIQLTFTYEGVEESYQLETMLQPNGYFLFSFTEEIISRQSLAHLLIEMDPSIGGDNTAVAVVTVYDHQREEIGSITKEFGQRQ